MPDTESQQRLNVLMVLNSLAPGGTEKSTLALAEPLRDHGVDLRIVILSLAPHSLEAQARDAGVNVVRLTSKSIAGRLSQLRRLILEDRPDVVHTALFEADVHGRLAAFRTGIPVVSSFVNTPYDPARLSDPNVTRWKLAAVRAIDAVTGRFMVEQFHAVSDGVRQANARALKLGADRISVVERGRRVDLDALPAGDQRAALRRSLGIGDQQLMVLNVGRQEYQKGQIDLIAAVPALVDRVGDVVVAIAGREGNATAVLSRAIDELGSEGRRVRLLGHRSDVLELLSAADVLAITSRFEGTAGVALEAFACGTPVVSARLEGMLGVLQHNRNARLVTPGSPRELADGIALVVEDQELKCRLIESGRADYHDRFTVDSAASRMAALYREVIR